MPSKTANDIEVEFLRLMLGEFAMPNDTINDLRSKYYSGVVNGTIKVGGSGGGIAPFPIGKTALLTRSDNGLYKPGATLGTEYAIGLYMPEGIYDRFGLQLGAAGTAASVLRVGLRPIDPAEGWGSAPLMQGAIPLDGALGDKFSTPSNATIPEGLYALTWCRIGDTGETATVQRSGFASNPHLVPLSYATAHPASGHSPVNTIYNTGVTGVLPNTAFTNDITTNQEGNQIPMISIRRSG
jgi:hypothetical protein